MTWSFHTERHWRRRRTRGCLRLIDPERRVEPPAEPAPDQRTRATWLASLLIVGLVLARARTPREQQER